MNSKLTEEFLKSQCSQDLILYGIRDNCGFAASNMKIWSEKIGIKLKIVRGLFRTDNPVYEKKDFTDEEKQLFLKTNLNFNYKKDRLKFIYSNVRILEEFKKVPHTWLIDSNDNIHDPSGYLQFVKKNFSKDLNKKRYIKLTILQ
jgi:hypothetical protein